MTRPLTPRQTSHHPGHRGALAPIALVAVLTLSVVSVSSAAGVAHVSTESQDAVPASSPWLPWLGCWQLVEETTARAEQPDSTNRFADRVVVCLTPSTTATSGVEVTTLANGEPVLVTTLVADGVRHPVEETACTGWRQSTWSSDRARLFARAEFACDADRNGETRRVSGVGLMTSSTTWLDIQLVDEGGRGEITVRRYRRASESTTVDAGATPLPADIRDRARAAARLASTTELGIDDVIEAGAAVDPTVVEALLIETRASFALDRHALIALDEGGIRGRVIDLMVALSFPDEFVVDRQEASTASSYGGGGFAGSVGPYWSDMWYPYYASPFGYYYGWSPYSSLYYLGPAVAHYAIVPGADDLGSRGRAYQGRGYSQIGTQGPTIDRRARRRGTTGTGIASTAATRSGGSDSSGNSRSSSGGGGAQASPRGYSRGGSSGRSGGGSTGRSGGGSTGRTARPRER